MANMSYCRFENTSSDLRDCSENLDAEGLSYPERLARWRLIGTCVQIANDYEDEGRDEAKPTKDGA
jgi:hypothetical protein